MRTIFINGKFTAQRVTGVQRAACCIVKALDLLLAPGGGTPGVRWVLLCPRNAALPALRNIEVRPLGLGAEPLHFWEQVLLPLASRAGVLLNLAGSAPLLSRRQICTVHDAAVFDFPQAHTRAFVVWYRFLFRRIARRASTLLTVSEFSKARLEAHLGIAPARVVVMRGSGDHMDSMGVGASTLQRLGLKPGSYFLAVGSANPVKNFGALLAAFGSLPKRCDAQLVVVGGANRHVFAPDSQPANLPGVVRAGSVSDEELKALYASALGLVFPSIYEGFGLPPLEAMACGCPVAASKAASLPEVCGDAALYFNPHEPAAIGAAMMRLYDEPELRQQLRALGAARAQTFSWDSAAGLLMKHIDPARTARLASS